MVGRPNVGKSSLINAICGAKVSIVSDKPQTTRHRVRGVYNRPDAQLVFVDTPGLHKPVTALGEKVNATALESLGEADDVDVVCLVLDATAPFGAGDRWVAERLDLEQRRGRRQQDGSGGSRPGPRHARRSGRVGGRVVLPGLGAHRRRPRRARSITSSPVLRSDRRCSPPTRCATSPRRCGSPSWSASSSSPSHATSCPYSIATRVSEWEGNRITVEIVVERESQKGMVIGKQGAVLKRVGERARAQLPEGTYLDLRVKVDKDWQRRPDRVERLGY